MKKLYAILFLVALIHTGVYGHCLLYTSDAADEL